MIIIFVEFIDQLIDYAINCASLTVYRRSKNSKEDAEEEPKSQYT